MQIADVVIEDINVLWLLMYICILDQDQDSLIVFFKLNEWRSLMSFILLNTHTVWVDFKIFVYVYVS